jgi:hypothetical protein
MELLQVPPGVVILSRVDNLASFSGFEVMFLGLLSDLFGIKCESPDHLSDPVAAMYWSPIAFSFRGCCSFFSQRSVSDCV